MTPEPLPVVDVRVLFKVMRRLLGTYKPKKQNQNEDYRRGYSAGFDRGLREAKKCKSS